MNLTNSICPFEKQEVICKICEGTKGAMESIFCERNNYQLLNKIFKSTNVKVEPVCGILSPICEFCRIRIDQFDDNFQPRCQEYVVEEIISSAPDDDPFNCLDPCSAQQAILPDNEAKVETRVKSITIEPSVPDVRSSSAASIEDNAEKFDSLQLIVEIDDVCHIESEENCKSSESLENYKHPTKEDPVPETSFVRHKNQKMEKKQVPNFCGIKQPTRCKVCDKQVVYIKDHMRIHNEEKKFKCPHCDRSFSQSNNLIYHVRKHTGEKPYACDKCEKSFICKSHLLSHSRSHINDQPYQCEICSRRFNQACNLTKHLRVHSGEKPYKCSICGKAFMNLSNMKAHEKRHRGERNFICEICSKGFYDSHHLERHLSVHTKEGRFKCVRCPKQFDLLEDLKSHASRHKDPMEVHSCDVCCKTFTSIHKLNLHLKSHTVTPANDEPVRCAICFKQFKRLELLDLHQRRMHGNIKQKKPARAIVIDPETAGKQLGGPFQKPYRCEVCSKEFNQAYNLKVHLKTHMLDERLHSCDNCKRMFRRRDHLEAHKRKGDCISDRDSCFMNNTMESKLEIDQHSKGFRQDIDLALEEGPDRQQLVIKFEV